MSAPRRESFVPPKHQWRSTYDPEGLYLFCSIVTIIALGVIGFALIAAVNS